MTPGSSGFFSPVEFARHESSEIPQGPWLAPRNVDPPCPVESGPLSASPLLGNGIWWGQGQSDDHETPSLP